MHDVLVIGGGLAGSIAALAAAGQGAKVAVATRSWGATAMSTGALDIAYTPAFSPQERTPRTLTDHIRDIIAHRPRHPYGVLGLAQTEVALQRGYEAMSTRVLEPAGLGVPPLQMAQENSGFASSLGTVVPAATALLPHRGLALTKPGRWGIVRFSGDGGFDATRVARGINHDANVFYGHRIDWVEIPSLFVNAAPMATARALDDRAALDRLVRELSPKLKGLDGLLTPPVLGLQRHAQVRRSLSEALGLPVVEALGHMPSVPGVRLQRALERALEAAGVQSIGEVVAPRAHGSRVTAVATQDNLEIRANAFVLASGRFIAGGVRWEDACTDTVLGIPVVTELGLMEDGSPHSVVRETPVESHPLMTAGVPVNRRLQPMRNGRVVFDNVFAAGMVIGGFASRYALCADGVALATGWAAGTAACGIKE